MAKAQHIKALVQAHAQGDTERFYAIALQLAAREARSGHTRFAQDLKRLVDSARSTEEKRLVESEREPLKFFKPRGELAGLLTVSHPHLQMSDMSLAPAVASKLKRVLQEQRQSDRILQHGLSPLRRLLLVGPPGTGKTMTASVLAGELGLPLFTVQLHVLITKYLGETAAKLRLVFDAIERLRAVYLFDEFDALGSDRASPNEVGEIRRVLNSFLQFIEADSSQSIVVAATNHPGLLDRAIFRRFDTVIRYDLPDPKVAAKLMQNRLAFLDTDSVDWKRLSETAAVLSHGEIVRACDSTAKHALLSDRSTIETADIQRELDDRIRSLAKDAGTEE